MDYELGMLYVYLYKIIQYQPKEGKDEEIRNPFDMGRYL